MGLAELPACPTLLLPRPCALDEPTPSPPPISGRKSGKLGGFLLLFLFLNLEISPSLLQIFRSALLCSVLLRAAFASGVLPSFLVCREFLHSSPRRLPSQPDPVLLAEVSWYDGQPFYHAYLGIDGTVLMN
ncbi:hypothetical protein SLEP1_g18804 [Rubroshorea leprosula]|uniref:Uncharacterized protein n=1 Tax=Rubroshorea leprosula TaxID=152421 RepID=A0AAV5IYT5_9ROSI|nr:hypothetical protein SLEP1_g18804 [Rubroshorea leprosula]